MSTKKQTVKKLTLPKGLPPLPLVPNGYDAWEYAGMGETGSSHLFGKMVSFLAPNGENEWANPDVVYSGNEDDSHYIVAVKKPIKRPAPKQPRAKAVKAVTVCASRAGEIFGDNDIYCLRVIDIEAAIEQAAKTRVAGFTDAVTHGKVAAREILASLGIIPKRKAK